MQFHKGSHVSTPDISNITVIVQCDTTFGIAQLQFAVIVRSAIRAHRRSRAAPVLKHRVSYRTAMAVTVWSSGFMIPLLAMNRE